MDLINLLTQLATWITVLLVLFTLWEMRKQRIASQKPDVIIPKATVYGYVYDFANAPRKDEVIPRWWSGNKNLKDGNEYWAQSQEIIKIYNVGIGVARNIEVKWTVDYDKALQQIKDYCYEHTIPIVLKVHDGNLGVYEKNYPLETIILLEGEPHEFDYLMPVSIASDGLATSIPGIFVELTSILIYLKSHYNRRHVQDRTFLEIKIPALSLKLQYDDLENFHYTKEFDVKFTLEGFYTFANEGDALGKQMFQGSIDFKKK